MSFSIRYFGTNTILIQDGDTHILVDPHFTRPSRGNMLRKLSPNPWLIHKMMSAHSIDKVDAILITHSHYDHALDAVEVAKHHRAVLYGSASMGMIAKASGLPDEQFAQLQPEETYQMGAFTVAGLPASHLDFPGPFDEWVGLNEEIEKPLSPPAWFWQYRSGQVYAFLMQRNGVTLLLNGSAGLFKTQPEICAETGVLCIGGMGWKRMESIREWFRNMVLEPGVQKLYLAHYDDFTKPFEEPLQWLPGTARAVRLITQLAESQPGLHVQILPHLEAIEIKRYG